MIRVDLLDYKNPVFESVVSIDSVDSVVPMEEESFKRFLSYFVEKFSGTAVFSLDSLKGVSK